MREHSVMFVNLFTKSCRHRWSWQYAGRVSYVLRDKPRSPESLCGSVVKHRNAEYEGLGFDSSYGLRNFFFVPRSWQDEKTPFSISLPSSKLTISLILLIKIIQIVILIIIQLNYLYATYFNYHGIFSIDKNSTYFLSNDFFVRINNLRVFFSTICSRQLVMCYLPWKMTSPYLIPYINLVENSSKF